MSNAPIFVFPSLAAQTYVGWGAVTLGAESSPDGFTTYHVTSLLDTLHTDPTIPGTLRDAVKVGKRRIVFDVGGNISLVDNLSMSKSYTTIDGISAPFPGITMRQSVFGFDISGPVNDFLAQGLRCIGAASLVTNPYPHANVNNSGDLLGIDGGSGPATRILIDHCTFLDTNDGCADRFGQTSFITVSNCLFSGNDTCCNSVRGQSNPIFYARDKETHYRNVYTRNTDRILRITGTARQIDFVSNIIHGIEWWTNASQAFGRGVMSLSNYISNPPIDSFIQSVNIEDNWLMNPIIPRTGLHARDNIYIGDLLGSLQPQQLVWIANNQFDLLETDVSTATGHIDMGTAEVAHISAATLKTALLAGVGVPAAWRTQFEIDLINEIQAYTP